MFVKTLYNGRRAFYLYRNKTIPLLDGLKIEKESVFKKQEYQYVWKVFINIEKLLVLLYNKASLNEQEARPVTA